MASACAGQPTPKAPETETEAGIGKVCVVPISRIFGNASFGYRTMLEGLSA